MVASGSDPRGLILRGFFFVSFAAASLPCERWGLINSSRSPPVLYVFNNNINNNKSGFLVQNAVVGFTTRYTMGLSQPSDGTPSDRPHLARLYGAYKQEVLCMHGGTKDRVLRRTSSFWPNHGLLDEREVRPQYDVVVFILILAFFIFFCSSHCLLPHPPRFLLPYGSSCCNINEACSPLLAALSDSIQGRLSFSPSDTHTSSQDFGNMSPVGGVAAVLFPASVSDIAQLLKLAYLAPGAPFLVSARGAGHSIHGQARPFVEELQHEHPVASSGLEQQQQKLGIVVDMTSLRGIRVFAGAHGEPAYVEAYAGELWYHVVEECLAHGLAPRSFTDYLHLSIGGTLSNAGISGQAFRFGPQISNVLQLEVVTGQFGIITKARIMLDKAPKKVRWIRALYSDFATFSRDQEFLISQPTEGSFDYVEGFVIANKPVQGYASVPFQGQHLNSSLIPSSAGPALYCLELVKKHDDSLSVDSFKQVVSDMLDDLSYIPSLVFAADVPYMEFLDRVHDGESKLRELGLWQTVHPWMNLFIPKSSIPKFDAHVFQQLLKDGINGPLIVYPLDRAKWDPRMSAVTPDEDTFYAVGILRYALPSESVNELLRTTRARLTGGSTTEPASGTSWSGGRACTILKRYCRRGRGSSQDGSGTVWEI